MHNIHKDHTQKETISQVIAQYSDLGLQPVPLIPNQKYLNLKDWSNRSIESLWAEHWSKYQTANIGLRMGDGILVIDCDSPETSLALLPILKPFNPPIVETTTANHHHVYFRYEDYDFPNKNYVKFKGKFSGEIRFAKGAQCVAPPSQVNGSTYTLVSGSFENIPTIPNTLLDMLMPSDEEHKEPKIEKPKKVKVEFQSNFDRIEVPLDKLKLAKHIEARIDWLKTAVARQPYQDKYGNFEKGRSEVEFSVVLYLIRCGYTEDEIYQILKNTARKGKSFQLTYDKAQQVLANNPTIDKLQDLYFNLPEMSFYAELIIKSIIATGVQFKTLSPSITKSRISEITGIVDNRTIQKYIEELTSFGLVLDHSGEYLKFILNDFQRSPRQRTYELEDVIVGKSLTDTLTSAKLIGELGIKVLTLMKNGVKTAKELAQKLGKELSTIYHILNKLIDLQLLDKNGKFFTAKTITEFVKSRVKGHIERIKELNILKRVRYDAYNAYLEHKNKSAGSRTLNSFLHATTKERHENCTVV